MCGSGKLNKGIEELLVQDFYRAVTAPNGSIKFNKVKMVNVTFVKFDECEKVYMFKNPSDKRLDSETTVIVDTVRGETRATVVSSIKILKKYVKDLQLAMFGMTAPLKDVIGVVETKYEKIEFIKTLSKEEETNEVDE